MGGGVATVLVPRRLYKMLAIKFAAKFASFATLIHRSCSSVQHFCRLLVFIALRLWREIYVLFLYLGILFDFKDEQRLVECEVQQIS